ncbi:DUF4870 family protein [Thiomicrorhabdus indica]|uniref:DUF4870 family protein n=1 Tax=Thiomicrorhabdus indica TaxID=2267253 RepID=UPI001F109A28|nr:hypothetical protein [Thiomicrorhabdus indica]
MSEPISEQTTPPSQNSTPSVAEKPQANNLVEANVSSAKINYILYLVGLVIGLTALVGVIFAYVKRSEENPDWLNAHYSFQIRTFWYGLAYLIVGSLLSVIIVGWLVILFWIIWLVVRCVKGMSALDAQRPIEGGFFSFGN